MTLRLPPRTIEWVGGLDGCARLIDQTRLPEELLMLECRDVGTMWEAIRSLRIRGAPAIGVAAAMGVVLGIREAAGADRAAFDAQLQITCDYLAGSRPTAVNLFWALDRMRLVATTHGNESSDRVAQILLAEATAIRDEDAAMCRAIGKYGEPLIHEGCGVLTHCNAGGLATSEFGTALAPMYVAHELGRRFSVFADETRPLLQGARLTAWELQQAGIDVTLLCDNMAASLMREGKVDLVIVGADRIAANGDVANKIGTYGVALLAMCHRIPFYVAAPSSTFDFALASGVDIPIEQRSADEIRRGFGKLTAPPDVPCYSPAFDVTPAQLITGIVTERGLIEPVSRLNIERLLKPLKSGLPGH